MKKLFLVLLTVAAVGLVPAAAEQNTYFKPGSLVAQAGVGYNLFFGFEAGADYSLAQWTPIPILPLDYGVAARGSFGLGGGIGAGAYGTVHYSFKALKTGIAFVDQLETSFGVGVDFVPGSAFPLTFGSYDTYQYHLDDKLAIELGWYSLTGGALGVTYKL